MYSEDPTDGIPVGSFDVQGWAIVSTERHFKKARIESPPDLQFDRRFRAVERIRRWSKLRSAEYSEPCLHKTIVRLASFNNQLKLSRRSQRNPS